MWKLLFISLGLMLAYRVSAEVPVVSDSSPPGDSPQKKMKIIPKPVAKVIEPKEESDLIQVTQGEKRKWRVGDQVCVTTNQAEVNCGKVVEANASFATVKMSKRVPLRRFHGNQVWRKREYHHRRKAAKTDSSQSTPKVDVTRAPPPEATPSPAKQTTGQVASSPAAPAAHRETPVQAPPEAKVANEKIAAKSSRVPASRALAQAEKKANEAESVEDQEILEHLKERELPWGSFTAGVGTGFNYLLLDARLGFAVSHHLALGIGGTLMNNALSGSSLSALGVFATADYYFDDYLQGFRAGAGVGYYSGTGGTRAGSLSFPVTFGWRQQLEKSALVLGIGAGFQYVTQELSNGSDGLSGILPLLAVDIGFCF